MWYLKENIHRAYTELYRACSWTCVRDRSNVCEPGRWMNVLKKIGKPKAACFLFHMKARRETT